MFSLREFFRKRNKPLVQENRPLPRIVRKIGAGLSRLDLFEKLTRVEENNLRIELEAEAHRHALNSLPALERHLAGKKLDAYLLIAQLAYDHKAREETPEIHASRVETALVELERISRLHEAVMALRDKLEQASQQ